MLDKITRTAIIKTTRVSIKYRVTDFSFFKRQASTHTLHINAQLYINTYSGSSSNAKQSSTA